MTIFSTISELHLLRYRNVRSVRLIEDNFQSSILQREAICINRVTEITNRLQEDNDLYYLPVKRRGSVRLFTPPTIFCQSM